jgi:eukaryotic-like serine/threonine-protein kinase
MDPALPDLPQQLQEHLGSAYHVERELGGGGMSRVFVAEDRNLSRKVVVKVLPPGLAATVSIDRFKREIMLSASLQHPNIVPVLSAGELGGLPYFIMPFIAGESLRSRITRGPLSVRETATIVKDVARALSYAHSRGVVHRDIKPDNILLSAGAAVVTDFGVAKALAASRERGAPPVGSTITGIGISLGTPQYMAPEQAAADPNTDHRADLYALGIVAYEMLAGAPPFHGRTPQALLAAQLTEPPAPITSRRYDVPQSLSEIIMRCLEKAPAARPKNANDLVRALDETSVSSGAYDASTATSRSGRRRKSSWRTPAMIVTALLALGAVGFALLRKQDVDTPAPSPIITSAISAQPRSIAVLPLQSVGGDAADASIALGMTSALTNGITRVQGLRVASQTAAAAAREGQRTLADMGRTLNVAMLLEGTVQRQREQLRINLRVVNVANDSTIWAGSFDGRRDDVFKVQDTMTQAVVSALATRLGT